MNPKYKLGLRAIKTAFSVFLCILIDFLLGYSDALLASVAAIICLQPTYNETFKVGVHRLIGTMIGGVIGYLILLFAHTFPHKEIMDLILAPISILIVIYFCNVINHPSSVVISCIVVLSVVTAPAESVNGTLMYVVNRVFNTSMGIIVAMFVNKFMFKKHTTNL